MKKAACVLSACLLFFFSKGQDAIVFFCENYDYSNYCDASWGSFSSPSNLNLVTEKIPIRKKSVVGQSCLELKWTSSTGGDWNAAIASPGWAIHNVTEFDSLICWINSPAVIDAAYLPYLMLEDINGNKSLQLELASYCDGLDNDSLSWQKVSIAVNDFVSGGSAADLTRIKTVYLKQSNADGVQHTLWIDEAHFQNEGFSYFVPDDTTNYLRSTNIDIISAWNTSSNSTSVFDLFSYNGRNSDGLELCYALANSGWISLKTSVNFNTLNSPLVLWFRSGSNDILEIKFIDTDGSVFGKSISLDDTYGLWEHIILYQYSTVYQWGGDDSFGELSKIELVLSGDGIGTVWFDEIGIGKEGLVSPYPPAGPVIDENSTLGGIGFLQRRDSTFLPEDDLILEYLKVMQDVSTVDQQLIPSMENDQAQTFNNALAAMAFMIKGEKERAERILDFFASATDTNNTDMQLQNFYYNGVARGFYQDFSISTYRDDSHSSDRWMGDMAWLLIACKQYQVRYDSDKYNKLIEIIQDLLISYFKDEGDVGYVQHGWIDGDTQLHESYGHHEGNIDCYIMFKMLGLNDYSIKIKNWLEGELSTLHDLPTDLYAWRVLAYGEEYAGLLDIPEYDLRYRKIIEYNSINVMGFYHRAEISVNNFWNDATGHMACAYLAYGDKNRGYFYANQLGYLIKEKTINTTLVHYIPYTLNTTGDYSWVDTSKGFISDMAWYIFARNEFNPFYYDGLTDVEYQKDFDKKRNIHIYPNPASDYIHIDLDLPEPSEITIDLYDLLGRNQGCLFDGYIKECKMTLTLPLKIEDNRNVNYGVYFIRISDQRGYTKMLKFFKNQ